MPKTKIKTHRGAAKRFSLTKKGKVKMNRSFRRHILTKKSTKRKRALRQDVVVDATNVQNMKKILPYV